MVALLTPMRSITSAMRRMRGSHLLCHQTPAPFEQNRNSLKRPALTRGGGGVDAGAGFAILGVSRLNDLGTEVPVRAGIKLFKAFLLILCCYRPCPGLT